MRKQVLGITNFLGLISKHLGIDGDMPLATYGKDFPGQNLSRESRLSDCWQPVFSSSGNGRLRLRQHADS